MRQETRLLFSRFIEGHQAIGSTAFRHFHSFIDEAVGPDVEPSPIRADLATNRRRMIPGKYSLRRVKEFDGPREIEVKGYSTQGGERGQFRVAFNDGLVLDNHSRRASRWTAHVHTAVRQKLTSPCIGSFYLAPHESQSLRRLRACSQGVPGQFSSFFFHLLK